VVRSYFLVAVGCLLVCHVCSDATRSIGRGATHRGESRRWYFGAGHSCVAVNISPERGIGPVERSTVSWACRP